ncbi:efflux RND transporter periplasmic adaptor subunit [bacterium]|nr:efflux RND transporter periplasmic adaptor subunit [bacterium]MBU1025746.1 efflux RND transporter periplasmic adaptor subunit [bacterium]
MKKLLFFMIISFLLFTLISCSRGEVKQEESNAVPVTTVKPEQRDIVIYYNTSSIIEADDYRQLGFTVGGEVVEMLKDEGERINKGEILAKLDADYFLSDLKTAESNYALSQKKHNAAKIEVEIYTNQLADSENDLIDSEKEFERYQRLFDKKVATKRELEQKELAFNRAKLKVDSARNTLMLAQGQILTTQDSLDAASAQLSSAGKRFGDAVLYAPFDGTISRKSTKVSTFIKAGEPVYEVISDGALKIETSLPERFLNMVHDGSTVLVDTTGSDCHVIPQQISRVHNDIDPKTGNFNVTMELDDSSNCLRHGMFAHLKCEIEKKENVMSLPVDAILELNGGRIVYKIENEKAVKTIITTGLESSEYIEITSGLSGNETIILSGSRYVVDDTEVRVIKPDSKTPGNSD